MSPEERQLLAGLFERTKSSAAGPRDQEAEAFIVEQVKAQPAAPYLLAQAVIVMEQALKGANERLQQLEAQVRELEARPQQSTSFLGGLFGGAPAPRQAPPPPPPQYRPAPPSGAQPSGPWGAPQAPQGGYAPQQGGFAPPQGGGFGFPQAAPGGGGFLKGALGAAAGVAGGVLLADGIRNMFSHHGGGMGGGMSDLGIGQGFEPAHETVINNYYGDQGPGSQAAEAGYDPGYDAGGPQDADYGGDGGYDDGGSGGGDDTYDA